MWRMPVTLGGGRTMENLGFGGLGVGDEKPLVEPELSPLLLDRLGVVGFGQLVFRAHDLDIHSLSVGQDAGPDPLLDLPLHADDLLADDGPDLGTAGRRGSGGGRALGPAAAPAGLFLRARRAPRAATTGPSSGR